MREQRRAQARALRSETVDTGRRGINEGDVYWLAPLRHPLIFAGLLMRRKGFRLTARGRELLREERAGELYALLFRTLDPRIFDFDRHPELQATVAYSLYKLRTDAREWSPSHTLAAKAWLESTKEPPDDGDLSGGVDLRPYAFRNRVLRVLVVFGLLDERSLPTPDPWLKTFEYRVTPLYERFLRFRFADVPPVDLFLVR